MASRRASGTEPRVTWKEVSFENILCGFSGEQQTNRRNRGTHKKPNTGRIEKETARLCTTRDHSFIHSFIHSQTSLDCEPRRLGVRLRDVRVTQSYAVRT